MAIYRHHINRRHGDLTNLSARLVVAFVIALIFLSIAGVPPAHAQLSVDEQHRILTHRAEDLVTQRRRSGPVPVTVASDDTKLQERFLPLDEAIRIALQHSEVIRVLTGVSASSSGRTIYDTAVATTAIDRAVARFDPVFSANSTWRKTETPTSRIDPFNPLRALIAGSQIGGNDTSVALSKTNRLGGVGSLTVLDNWNYGNGGPGRLSPSHRPQVDLSYTQPLLAGAGRAANEAPIIIARYELDRSYFQFKDSMQQLVRSVIAGYWSLVEARTQLWAREIQVRLARETYERAAAQFRAELVDIGEVAQRQVAFASFKANLVTARGNVIQREAALRNVLGLPPSDGQRLVPSTPPTRDRIEFDWNQLVETAQSRRPDLIELHLILHADRQRLLQARNQAKPALNAVAVHRWNGLKGQMQDGGTLRSQLGDNPSWSLGVTFEVPLTLRASRATARSTELLLARDRANIQQGLHSTEHTLATTIRNIDQFHEQYKAFQEMREAARVNLGAQSGREVAELVIFLNVLQAIQDWGNAVSSEASSLTQYNSALATLESETGTILDTHGIVFTEERFAAIGPMGKHAEPEYYPRDLRPAANSSRYPDSGDASEEAFDLKDFSKPPASRQKTRNYDDDPASRPAEPDLPDADGDQSSRFIPRMRLSRLLSHDVLRRK